MPPTAGYYKRYRMEAGLRGRRVVPLLPAGFDWVPWDDTLLDLHARVKARAFAGELDGEVFPSLADPDGCTRLMHAIRDKPGFVPGATWLVGGRFGCVGTVQGLIDPDGWGAVQNLGVVPGFRGRGLGGALLMKAMDGFRAAGARRVHLEVTADNAGAVAMYRRHGFRARKTIYKPARVPVPVLAE